MAIYSFFESYLVFSQNHFVATSLTTQPCGQGQTAHLLTSMRHWNKLPRQAMGAPTLAAFKIRLDWALNNYQKMSLPMAGGPTR